jgi:hypothetical protein
MARARNIKPGFFESEQLGRCPLGARLLFIAMWQVADRDGKLEERLMRLRAYTFPYDSISMEEINEWVDTLERESLIERYSVGDGKYVKIPKFTKHQNPHVNEKDSTIPDKPSASTVQAPEFSRTILEKELESNSVLVGSSTQEILPLIESGILNPDVPHSPAAARKPKQKVEPGEKFIKPTIEQVMEFVRVNKITNVDPEYFWYKNESIGWVTGKAKTPIKCWRSTVRTWAKNGYGSGYQPQNLIRHDEQTEKFVPKPKPVENPEDEAEVNEMLRGFLDGTMQ